MCHNQLLRRQVQFIAVLPPTGTLLSSTRRPMISLSPSPAVLRSKNHQCSTYANSRSSDTSLSTRKPLRALPSRRKIDTSALMINLTRRTSITTDQYPCESTTWREAYGQNVRSIRGYVGLTRWHDAYWGRDSPVPAQRLLSVRRQANYPERLAASAFPGGNCCASERTGCRNGKTRSKSWRYCLLRRRPGRSVW